MALFRDKETKLEDGAGMVEAADLRQVIEKATAASGQLGIEIVDIAGHLDEVNTRVNREAALFEELLGVVRELDYANQTVDSASGRAEEVSAAASENVESSRSTITQSVEEIDALIESVSDVARRLTGLEQSLADVTRATRGIKGIAKQTNLLALNASIEAARAGERGYDFANVADEVKRLAGETAEATQDIDHTLEQLTETVRRLVAVGQQSSRSAERVQGGNEAIQAVIDSAAQAMATVNADTRGITTAVREIEEYTRQTVKALGDTQGDVHSSSQNLDHAAERIQTLLVFTEELLNIENQTDASTEDAPYLRLAQQTAAEISQRLEAAIDAGEISMDALFDTDYQPIAGSDPPQYTTAYCEFTDQALPPIQEPVYESDSNIVACCACDVNGYIATHNRHVSHPQRPGEPLWNKANSRHRTMFDDRVGKTAGQNTKPFLLQLYRRNMGGGKFVLSKDASAPIYVKGRHWGGLRLIYQT